jgi:hypothetical protein
MDMIPPVSSLGSDAIPRENRYDTTNCKNAPYFAHMGSIQ